MLKVRNIHALSDFVRNYKSHVSRLKKDRTPEILTINGKAEVVVLDVDSFQELMDKAERLETMEVFQEGRAAAQRDEPAALEPLFHRLPEVTLSDEDWQVFSDALLHPPEPTEAFKAAWKEFQEHQE